MLKGKMRDAAMEAGSYVGTVLAVADELGIEMK
jgi:hypothetical protein